MDRSPAQPSSSAPCVASRDASRIAPRHARSIVPGLAAAIAAMAFAVAPVHAQNQIYRCESADGPPVFQNAPGRGCKALDLPPLTSVPGLQSQPQTAPRQASAPASFPRVGEAQQRERDSDRRRILEQELNRERARLADVRREYNGGEPERQGDERNYQKYLDRVERLKRDLSRSEGSVASLQRELDGLK